MNKLGIHCFVVGRVHGVCFRASTQRKALALELSGWVRNIEDGRVEVMAFGGAQQLELLKEWLWQGPPAAKVTAVECIEVVWEEVIGFVIK